MTEAEDKKDPRGTLRVDKTLYDALLDEQDRLRRSEGRKPSHTELVQRIFDAYQASRLGVESKTGAGKTRSALFLGAGASIPGDRTQDTHLLLELILNSGYNELIDAITRNLKAFAFAADLAEKHGVNRNAPSIEPGVSGLIEKHRRTTKRGARDDEGTKREKRGTA